MEWQESAVAGEVAPGQRGFEKPAVVCQFGVMFFPDKIGAFREARRVLTRRGVFIFSVWDRVEENDFAEIVATSLASLYPADPPRFLARCAIVSAHVLAG